MTKAKKTTALDREQSILQGDGCTVTLHGESFTLGAMTPRRTRPLMSAAVRLQPALEQLGSAVEAAGKKKANFTPDAMAQMLDVIESLCCWLGDAMIGLDAQDAIDNATEQEIMESFNAIRKMLQDPFIRRMKSFPSGKKR